MWLVLVRDLGKLPVCLKLLPIEEVALETADEDLQGHNSYSNPACNWDPRSNNLVAGLPHNIGNPLVGTPLK